MRTENRAEYSNVKTCEDCEDFPASFLYLEKTTPLEEKYRKVFTVFTSLHTFSQVHEITEGGFWGVKTWPFSLGGKNANSAPDFAAWSGKLFQIIIFMIMPKCTFRGAETSPACKASP
jgi:hypothetical protein